MLGLLYTTTARSLVVSYSISNPRSPLALARKIGELHTEPSQVCTRIRPDESIVPNIASSRVRANFKTIYRIPTPGAPTGGASCSSPHEVPSHKRKYGFGSPELFAYTIIDFGGTGMGARVTDPSSSQSRESQFARYVVRSATLGSPN